MDLLSCLRAMPPGALVPRDWVLVELEATTPVAESATVVDLTAAQVGELLGRQPGTIRAWCEARILPGAYRLLGREWRVPRAALEALQQREREG